MHRNEPDIKDCGATIEDICECCGQLVNKKQIDLCCNVRELHFLGSGYVLYFQFVKHAIFLLLTLLIGVGIFGII